VDEIPGRHGCGHVKDLGGFECPNSHINAIQILRAAIRQPTDRPTDPGCGCGSLSHAGWLFKDRSRYT
jgi:hypothetical protein